MQLQTVKRAGTKPTFAKPTSSDTAPVGSALIVKNDSAGSIDVTLITEGVLPTGDDYPDKVYTVAAAGEVWIPVLREYQPAAGGDAAVTFSATTSVTAACVSTK
jgi:hypothetical protein